MADVKITEMTPDASVGGGELLPVSDAGNPKSVTITNIKDFVVDAIEAISAASSVTGADGIYILQSGALKPVDIDVVAQHVIDTVWGKTAESSPADEDTMPLYDDGGSAEKTVTLAVLAEYIRDTIEASILDISELADGSGTLADSDYLLVTQGTTAKQVTLGDINAAIYAALGAYVAALDAVVTSTAADVFYCIQGGTEKKVTLAEIATYLGDPPSAPAATTANNLPQWSNETGDLKDGLSVATTVSTPGTNGAVPTEMAVRAAISEATNNLYDTLWIPADQMYPSATNGADSEDADYASNGLTRTAMLFAGDTADETAEFTMVMPESWDRSTIKAKVYWAPGHADANASEYVRFSLSAVAVSNDDALDVALGSAQTMDDQAIADDDLHITPASAAITVGGTPALDDLVHFKLTRDYDYEGGGGTAMDVDARVFGVLIQYKKSNAITAW